MRTVELHCMRCARRREFEQPPCADGHGGDCDELVCTRCGSAVLVGSYPPVRLRRRRPQRAGPRAA